MTMQYDYHSGRRSSGTLFSVIVSLALGATLLGVFVHRARVGLAGKLASYITGEPMNVISDRAVVDRVQRLNRLETAVYTLDTVVESDESSPVLPDALAGDHLLMIVQGQTIAGIDMSQLKPENVVITEHGGERDIKITLPPSQVFLTTIDNGHSRVYTRETGLFVKADPNLETQTRVKAQGQLQQAALSDGILDVATKNARTTIAAMLQGLGFAHVEVQ
ncbi:DUF4230 domain-containing protein [Granulicella sp. 5B5]|uniref:DUF4230 domain-containing protein n=1 Tax=Granulicella sp. 5B5 TaxID=1617967 RepID=UPI0015F71ADD|nr:DUF4230 domain-containing protein [Granulicella sp. 5B5]QMV18412.1 DUF4230 domain-containing protein [Granulicella sp. 5B5]